MSSHYTQHEYVVVCPGLFITRPPVRPPAIYPPAQNYSARPPETLRNRFLTFLIVSDPSPGPSQTQARAQAGHARAQAHAQAKPKPGPSRAQAGFLEIWDLEIWEFRIQEIQKMKILKIGICHSFTDFPWWANGQGYDFPSFQVYTL